MTKEQGNQRRVMQKDILEGDIAQLGEHLPCKQGVSGSIPLISIEIRNTFHL